jgi:hypothetical protein
MLLARLEPEEISSANKNIVEYIGPAAHLYALGFATVLDDIRKTISVTDYRDSTDILDRQWASLDIVFRDISNSTQAISRIAPENSEKFHTLLQDYRDLLDQAEQLRTKLTSVLQRDVSLAALSESRKSIRQADSIRRLTLLAFVFVPLNFVTSFFGMNTKEFGTGKVKLWICFTVASVVTLTVLVTAGVLRGLEQWWKWPRLLERSTLIIRLALLSPSLAFWLVLFICSHSSRDNTSFIRAVGLNYYFISKEEFSSPMRYNPECDLPPFEWSWKPAFWQRKAKDMRKYARRTGGD